MKATRLKNENGTFTYLFCEDVFKKASKREYRFMLVGKAMKSKGASKDGDRWFPIGLGNNEKSIVSSWRGLYGHCDLQVIEIN